MMAKSTEGPTTDRAIQEHYGAVACAVDAAEGERAEVGWCCTAGDSDVSGGYEAAALESLPTAALAASRGCGDPVAVAALAPGETVLDLGSGGGIDALLAAQAVGATGHVIGVDMTEEMIELARKNAEACPSASIEFTHGRLETLPLEDESVDVVISNCVINLCEDKPAVFAEAARVLRPGGRIVVSDILQLKPVKDAKVLGELAHFVGCRRGVQTDEAYKTMVEQAGFVDVSVTPKTIYTAMLLAERAHRRHREEEYAAFDGIEELDGALGSVIMKAYKG